jgi:hypothetical protein
MTPSPPRLLVLIPLGPGVAADFDEVEAAEAFRVMLVNAFRASPPLRDPGLVDYEHLTVAVVRDLV